VDKFNQDGLPIIKLENVSKLYYTGTIETSVLRNVNFSIQRASFVVILGPSGCGKTTLLNQIGGLDQPTRGKIFFEGQEILFNNSRSLLLYRRKNLGFIFQFYNLLPTLTALENVEIVLDLMIQDKKLKRKRSLQYLENVGMEDKANKFPYQLSGGEQQRIAIARALVKEPRLLIADEPTGNLDEEKHREIIELMLRMSREKNITVIVATHNLRVTSFADYIIHIKQGQLIENGANPGEKIHSLCPL